MASSGQTISSEALRFFRYHYFVRHSGKKVFFLVYEHLFLVGQSKTIREILEDNGIPIDDSTVEYRFSDNEILKLSGKPEDLDITLMYKICKKCWDIRVGFPGIRLRNLVTEIKNERNNVSHEDYKISKTGLEKKIKDFQAKLKYTLDAARSLRPRRGIKIDKLKIDALKKEIQDAVPNLLEKIREKYEPTNQDELLKLQDEIKGFWYQLSEYILQLTQEELKSLYGRLCQIWPYDWLAQFGVTDPCRATVSLKMDQEKEFDGCRINQGYTTLDQREILDIKDPDGEDLKASIISGCAGAGKSTIMSSILEKWQKGISDMPNLSSFQILLYMQFRNHCHDNFDDFLQSLLPQTLGLFDLKLIKSVILHSKCLILCDGYDEANDKSRKLFEELISLNYKDMKVVVTTRPGNTETVTKTINKAKLRRINLSVLGLREEDRKPLIERITTYLIADDVTKREEMRRQLFQVIDNMNQATRAILVTPLYFNLFILLFIKSSDMRERIISGRMNSALELYIHLEEHKQERIIEKTGIQREFLEKFDELYLKYSIQNYKEKKYELYQNDVDIMKSETQCPEVIDNFDCLLSSYFNIKHSTEGTRIKKLYCYRHATELAFAAARKISEDISKSYRMQTGNVVESVLVSNRMCQQLGDLQYRSVERSDLFVFFVGILYRNKRDVFYSVIDDVHSSLLTLFGHRFEELFVFCIESTLDTKVVESLCSVLRRTSATDALFIEKIGSLFVLPELLPRLKPKCLVIEFEIDGRYPAQIDFPSLKKTLEVATHHNIPVQILQLELDINDEAQNMLGRESFTVDILNVSILDMGHVNVDTLCPFRISAEDLTVQYGGTCGLWRTIAVINAVWPRKIKDVSETESEGDFSSSPSSSKSKKLDFQHHKLWIHNPLREGHIRLLLQFLTIQPLEELIIHTSIDYDQEIISKLSTECRIKGFGELTLY